MVGENTGGIFSNNMMPGKSAGSYAINGDGDDNQLIDQNDIQLEVEHGFHHGASQENGSSFKASGSAGESKLKNLMNSVNNMSKVGASQMQKSVSGFDIGQQKQYGAFFSGIRQSKAGEQSNFVDTSQMKGSDYIEKLIKQ